MEDLKEVSIPEDELKQLEKYLSKNILKYRKISLKKYVIYNRKILMKHFDLCTWFIIKYIKEI